MNTKLGLAIGLALAVAAIALPRLARPQFEVLPADENTYVVHHDLAGLQCVQGVGGPGECAVPNADADEGGFPWTKVPCRKGDRSVTTFAWQTDTNRPVKIFEAPPALSTSPSFYTIPVRLGRTCMRMEKGAR